MSGTMTGAMPFWLGSRSNWPTRRAGFSDTSPTTSWVWSWSATATGALASDLSPSLTSSTVMLPPNVGGRA